MTNRLVVEILASVEKIDLVGEIFHLQFARRTRSPRGILNFEGWRKLTGMRGL